LWMSEGEGDRGYRAMLRAGVGSGWRKGGRGRLHMFPVPRQVAPLIEIFLTHDWKSAVFGLHMWIRKSFNLVHHCPIYIHILVSFPAHMSFNLVHLCHTLIGYIDISASHRITRCIDLMSNVLIYPHAKHMCYNVKSPASHAPYARVVKQILLPIMYDQGRHGFRRLICYQTTLQVKGSGTSRLTQTGKAPKDSVGPPTCGPLIQVSRSTKLTC
jgi:hypothetical protein